MSHKDSVARDIKYVFQIYKLTVGELIPFPVTPVTQVVIHDLDEEVPENGAFTDISGALVSCVFPSPEPQGSPLIGSLLPISEFPAHYEMLLTIGYPVQETTTPVEQFDVPTLVPVKTGYTGSKIHLVFSRPVTGVAIPDNFTLTVAGEIKAASSVEFSKGSDRKSTRLNSSHQIISYAVFCLK